MSTGEIAIAGAFAFLAVVIALSLWLVRRGVDPARAVASVAVAAGAGFTLRFTPATARAHDLLLRFDVDHGGGEDDYGITVTLAVRVGGAPAQAIEHRIGDGAPAIGPRFTTNTSLYWMGASSGPEGNNSRAIATLATIPAAAGAPVEITGRVTMAGCSSANSLLVYVLPA